MSRIAGILEIFEKEVVDGSIAPSQVEVNHLWRMVSSDIDKLESLLFRIGQACNKLRKWQYLKLVSSIKIEATMDYDKDLAIWIEKLKKYVVETDEKGFYLFEEGDGI